MAIRPLIDKGLHFEETIPINFMGIPDPINFKL